MNSDKLQELILTAIEKKKISQRELAKLTGISRSTLNDILNGKTKKINIDDLYQISIPLELNLENLLEACGFNRVLKSLNFDRYAGMSDRELKEKLDEYQQLEMNLLDWDAKKRKHAREVVTQLFNIKNKIEMSESHNVQYTANEILEDIKKASDELKPILEKYDYSQLPRNK